MHQRISNFSAELNGTFVRCLDNENNPGSMPFSLYPLNGLNGSRLSAELTDNRADRAHLKDSTFTTIASELSR